MKFHFNNNKLISFDVIPLNYYKKKLPDNVLKIEPVIIYTTDTISLNYELDTIKKEEIKKSQQDNRSFFQKYVFIIIFIVVYYSYCIIYGYEFWCTTRYCSK